MSDPCSGNHSTLGEKSQLILIFFNTLHTHSLTVLVRLSAAKEVIIASLLVRNSAFVQFQGTASLHKDGTQEGGRISFPPSR